MSDEGLRNGERFLVLTSDDLVALAGHERAAQRAGIRSAVVDSVRHELLERLAAALYRRRMSLLKRFIELMNQHTGFGISSRGLRTQLAPGEGAQLLTRAAAHEIPMAASELFMGPPSKAQKAREKTRENVRRRPPRTLR